MSRGAGRSWKNANPSSPGVEDPVPGPGLARVVRRPPSALDRVTGGWVGGCGLKPATAAIEALSPIFARERLSLLVPLPRDSLDPSGRIPLRARPAGGSRRTPLLGCQLRPHRIILVGVGSRESSLPPQPHPLRGLGAGFVHGDGTSPALHCGLHPLQVQRSVRGGDVGGVHGHHKPRDFHGVEAVAKDSATDFVDDQGRPVKALGPIQSGETHEKTVAFERGATAARLDLLREYLSAGQFGCRCQPLRARPDDGVDGAMSMM